MKKHLLLFAMILLPLVASAHDIEVPNADGVTIYYNYITNNTELEVIFRGKNQHSYSDEYQGNIVIPEEVTYMDKTYKVTSIRTNTFYDCKNLVSVTIPNSVTNMGDYTFQSCPSLTSVTIGNSVTNIGAWAFYECSSLTTVNIPNCVTSIGDYAFCGCSSLTSITIPNSVTSIGNDTFTGCSGLTSVTIPNSVTSIGKFAFRGCSGLSSVTIPNSVTSIGVSLFYGCSSLASIKVEEGNSKYDSRGNCNAVIEKGTNKLLFGCKNTIIPNSVATIGDYAFSECSNLISVTIPNSVTRIGDYAFYKCPDLTSVTFGNSVSRIGVSTFSYCPVLTSVTIPNSVSSIDHYAFRGCTGLTSVTIGSSVSYFGYYVFSGCTGLNNIKVEDGNSTYDSRDNCNAIIEKGTNKLLFGCKNTIIPNSVTSIGEGAFSECSSLTSINIPNSVTSIGVSTFKGCSGLTSIYISNSVTSIGQSAFRDCSSLNSVTIGGSVKNIDEWAFEGVDIPIVISLISIPFKIESVFTTNTLKNATLYVPKGTIDDYKSTRGWRDFENIVEGKPTGIKITEDKKNKNIVIYDLNGRHLQNPQKGINIINSKKVVMK